MYTVEEVMGIIRANPMQLAAMAFMVYGFGFIVYGYSLALQIREHKAPFEIWQHAWFFGHDLTFVTLYGLWFHTVDFWLFKALWAGCVIYVGIEFYSLYLAVKYERDDIWGRYYDGPVSVKDAWYRGLVSYFLGFALFYITRLAIGDIMCLVLMMSTIPVTVMPGSWLAERRRTRLGSSFGLIIAMILTTICTWLPNGYGWYATAVPAMRGGWFTALGILSILCAIRYLIVYRSLPAKPELVDGKGTIW